MKKDKLRLFIMAVITIALLYIIFLFFFSFPVEDLNIEEILTIIIPLVLIVFMSFFVRRRYMDIKAGMPLEDERSKKIMNKTAAMSFYTTFYWLLLISWLKGPIARMLGLEYLDAGQTTAVAILGMTVVFFGFWLYYNKKGKID